MRKLLTFLAALVTCVLLLPTGSADARGGGRGGGMGRGGASLGGGRRGGNRGKDKKVQQARRDRENRDGFRRDAADDAR